MELADPFWKIFLFFQNLSKFDEKIVYKKNLKHTSNGSKK